MHCLKCGKFMRFEDISINSKVSTIWHKCVCGARRYKRSSCGPLISRDAIALVSYK